MGNAGEEEVILKDTGNMPTEQLKEVELDVVKSCEDLVSKMAESLLDIQKCKSRFDFIYDMAKGDYEAHNAVMNSMTKAIEATAESLARLVKVKEAYERKKRI